MKTVSKESFEVAALIVLATVAAILTALFFQFTVDDAYITFRHSLNLVADGVLSWNLEGPREEAFTNPLYVLMGAIGIKLGIKPELPIKIVSLGIFFLWLNRAIKICVPAARPKRLLISAVFLLCIPSYIHAYSGLETLLFAYLLFEYLCSEEVGHPRDISISFLLVLCRPEGALFVVTSLGCLLFRRLRGSHYHSPQDRLWLFPSLAIGFFAILVLSYKISYFGDFLPNTFYAKTGRPQGLGAILGNIKSSAPWLFFASIVFQWRKLRGAALAKYSGFAIIYLVYIRSGLAMNYADRFWYQLFWPLIVHEISANQNIESFLSLFNISKPLESFSSSRSAAFALAGFGWIVSSITGSPSSSLHLSTYFGRAIRSHANLGYQLSNAPPGSSKIWVGDVGLIPYYSNRMTYDLNFLGTKQIAKEGVSESLIAQKRPDVFILYASGCSPDQTRTGQQDHEISFIQNNRYQFIGGFAWQKDYCMNVYASPDVAPYLKNSTFLSGIENSKRNMRGNRSGFFEDILLSYNYLFTPASKLPSISK